MSGGDRGSNFNAEEDFKLLKEEVFKIRTFNCCQFSFLSYFFIKYINEKGFVTKT